MLQRAARAVNTVESFSCSLLQKTSFKARLVCVFDTNFINLQAYSFLSFPTTSESKRR
jgi:hypothetical protein